MQELPLVLFTVLSQMAIGALVTIWLLELTGRKVSAASGFFISASVTGIAIVGVLLSLLHLGHPFEAYRALRNIGVSWLSREVTFYGVFILISLAYCFYWKKDQPANRKTTGALAALFGIGTIFSSGMIYTIPAVPAWNNASTTLSFFLTSVLLGPILVGAFLLWRKEGKFNFSLITFGGLIVSALLLVVYLTTLFSGLEEAIQTGSQLVGSSMFWIRIVLLVAVLAMLIPTLRGNKSSSAAYLTLVFCLLTISELLGRVLFYSTGVHL